MDVSPYIPAFFLKYWGIYVLPLLPEYCWTAFSDWLFPSVCVKMAVKVVLDTSSVSASAFVRVPQILKVLSAGNVVGLSETSFYAEVLMITCGISYNFLRGNPFFGWAELIFLGIQSSTLLGLYWALATPSDPQTSVYVRYTFVGLVVGYAFLVNSGYFPLAMLQIIGVMPIPLVSYASIKQIMKNYNQGHTGQVSAISTFMLALGNVVRFYTNFITVGDKILLAYYAWSCLLKSTVVFQIFWYKAATVKALSNKSN